MFPSEVSVGGRAYHFSEPLNGTEARYTCAENGLSAVLVGPRAGLSAPEWDQEARFEFELAERLPVGFSQVPIGLARIQGRLFLVREDLDAGPVGAFPSSPMPLGLFLDTATAIAIALQRLHQAGVVHGALTPLSFLRRSDKTVVLKDFGRSFVVGNSRTNDYPADALTARYLSPEGGGSVGVPMDARSDLYSLGAVFYEYLVGRPPFESADPQELLYAHIARPVASVDDLRPGLPASVTDLVNKLVRKTPEDRFQNTAHLILALRECGRGLDEADATGFFRGQIGSTLKINYPLIFGREREFHSLTAHFERLIATGDASLLWVTAVAGMGKTALVKAFLHGFSLGKMYSIHVKFDQNQLELPFSALATGLGDLLRGLQHEDGGESADFPGRLAQALGAHLGLLAELIPELRDIVGPTEPAPQVAPSDARHQFEFIFRKFILIFAKAERPLIIFLDDLQWADEPTMSLMRHVLQHSDTRHLMIIGASRVVPHADMAAAQLLPESDDGNVANAADARVSFRELHGVEPEALQAIAAEVLGQPALEMQCLAGDLYAHTDGNPLLATELLRELLRLDRITIDRQANQWIWMQGDICRKSMDVSTLIASRISLLAPEVKTALQCLSLLGESVPTELAAAALCLSPADTNALLAPALAKSILRSENRRYKFTHDRVQEACVQGLAGDARVLLQIRIGRALAREASLNARPDMLVRAATHLNQGRKGLQEADDKAALFEINMRAGAISRRNVAYTSALNFYQAAIDLLPPDAWSSNYVRTFEVHFARIDAQYLCGLLDAANEGLAELGLRAQNPEHRLTALTLQMNLHLAAGRGNEAVATGLAGCRLLGIGAPETEIDAQAMALHEHEAVQARYKSLGIDSQLAMKQATGVARYALDMLSDLAHIAYAIQPRLFPWVAARIVHIAWDEGYTEKTCVGVMAYALLLNGHYFDFAAGREFSEFGRRLTDHYEKGVSTGAAYHVLANHIIFWHEHFSAVPKLQDYAFNACLEVGDLLFATCNSYEIVWQALERGESIEEAWRLSATHLRFVLDCQCIPVIATLRLLQHCFAELQGGAFVDSLGLPIDRGQNIEIAKTARFVTGTVYNHIAQQWKGVVLGDLDLAVEAGEQAEALLYGVVSLPVQATYYFLRGLVICRLLDQRAGDPENLERELVKVMGLLEMWARNCPANYMGRFELVRAEAASLRGDFSLADVGYENAARNARLHGFPYVEALAHESAAKSLTRRGLETSAHAHWLHARSAYVRWGAKAKAQSLDHALLVPSGTYGYGRADKKPVSHGIDLDALLAVLHSVAVEIELPKLIEQIMRTALQHAGADRGVLFFEESGALFSGAAAKASDGEITVELSPQAAQSGIAPASILAHVVQTQDALVLNDALRPHEFENDPYLLGTSVRSLLCIPLVANGRLLGLLYLENGLAPYVFSSTRLELLRAIASQGSVSLSNARLYADLKAENLQRRTTEERLRLSEDFLAEGQRLSHTGSFGWNASSRLMSWSAETYRILDLEESELPSEGLFMERLHEDDRPRLQVAFETAAVTDEQIQGSFRLALSGGRIKNVDIIARLSFSPAGQRRFIGAISDVTAARLAEATLLQAQADLSHATRVNILGELTASITHEVLQPIAGIETRAQAAIRWLARNPPNAERAIRSVEEILVNSKRTIDVVNGLKQFGRKNLDARVVLDVADLVKGTVRLIRRELDEAGIKLSIIVPSGVSIYGDKVQLQQILINFCLNGIHSIQRAAGSVRGLDISASLTDGDSQVEIAVADTGTGIEEHQFQRMFEAFFTTKEDGMGIGLSVSRTIALNHGGSVLARNNARHGATVSLKLPVTEPTPAMHKPRLSSVFR